MNNNIYDLDKKRYEKKIKKISDYKFLYLLILCLIIIVIGAFVLINKNHIKIMKAQHGQVIDGFNTKALVIREEKVYYAPLSGTVKLMQKEGKRVSQGQQIVKINKTYLHNDKPGIISYATDDLENNLKPEKVGQLKLNQFNNLHRDYTRIDAGKYITKGEPVFRIINNYNLYIMFKTTTKKAEQYQKQELVFIRPQKMGTNLIKGRVADKYFKNDRVLMLIKLNRFISEWSNIRWIDIKFIKNIYRGIVIPRQAIFTQPSGQGVLCINSIGKYKFNKIKIKNGTKQKVVVTGLELGEKVIVNPATIDYGE